MIPPAHMSWEHLLVLFLTLLFMLWAFAGCGTVLTREKYHSGCPARYVAIGNHVCYAPWRLNPSDP